MGQFLQGGNFGCLKIDKKLPTFEKSTIEKSLSGANPASRTPIEEVKKRKIIKI